MSQKNKAVTELWLPLRWKLFRCGGICFVALVGLLLLIDRWLPYALLSHHNYGVDLSQRPAAEQLSVTAADGIVTRGWLVDAPDRALALPETTAATLILLHGLGANRQAVLDLGLALQQAAADQDVALAIAPMDLRGHGESDGTYFTYGYHEAQDIAALLDELERQNVARSQPPSQLQSQSQLPMSYALLGVSAGGAVAIAAAQDERIDALITIGTFADLAATAKTQTEWLPDWWRDRVLRRAEAIAQFSVTEAVPAHNLARVEIPVLIAHGDQDGYIPFSNAKLLYRTATATVTKQLYAITGADHANMLSTDSEALHNEIIQFLSLAFASNSQRN